MKRIKVESSNIVSVGYDVAEQILEVEFYKGTIYQYFNVPWDKVLKMMFGESIGKYFMKNIVKIYESSKVASNE